MGKKIDRLLVEVKGKKKANQKEYTHTIASSTMSVDEMEVISHCISKWW